MGTVCEVAVQNGTPADIERAFAEAARVEAMLSTWRDDSELARVNRGEVQASPELRALLDTDSEAPDLELSRVLTLERLLELVSDTGRQVELAIETKHPTRWAGQVFNTF